MTQLIKIDNQEFNLDRENETFFATQEQIANIFEINSSVVSRHLKNIFECGELDKNSNLQKMQNSTKPIYLFSLDAIISVGYRVNSIKAVNFRKKATKILKEYLTTGEVIKKEYTGVEFATMLLESEMAKAKLALENKQQQSIIQTQNNTIHEISNTQDSYSVRESKNRLMCEEGQLKDFLKSKKWIQYLSDGEEGKKMYSTAYSKENGFAIDKAVLNKANKKFYHQCRITNKGMDYLIKHRQEILTF